jgi:hypothetical protein
VERFQEEIRSASAGNDLLKQSRLSRGGFLAFWSDLAPAPAAPYPRSRFDLGGVIMKKSSIAIVKSAL